MDGTMRSIRMLVVMVVVASIVVLAGGPARACSCAMLSPPGMLELADAAFVGRVVVVTGGGMVSDGVGLDASLITFDVDQVLKGDLPSQVEVATPSGGAACGASFAPDRPSAVLIVRAGSGWSTNLCLQQVSVQQLLRASGQEPRPPTGETSGTGPAQAIVGAGDDPGGRLGGVLLIAVLGAGGFVLARVLRRRTGSRSAAAP